MNPFEVVDDTVVYVYTQKAFKYFNDDKEEFPEGKAASKLIASLHMSRANVRKSVRVRRGGRRRAIPGYNAAFMDPLLEQVDKAARDDPDGAGFAYIMAPTEASIDQDLHNLSKLLGELYSPFYGGQAV
jgi:hypothetical protein